MWQHWAYLVSQHLLIWQPFHCCCQQAGLAQSSARSIRMPASWLLTAVSWEILCIIAKPFNSCGHYSQGFCQPWAGKAPHQGCWCRPGGCRGTNLWPLCYRIVSGTIKAPSLHTSSLPTMLIFICTSLSLSLSTCVLSALASHFSFPVSMVELSKPAHFFSAVKWVLKILESKVVTLQID